MILLWKSKTYKIFLIIVTWNGKIVWKIVWIHYFCSRAWFSENTSTQLCVETKTNIFFKRSGSWSTDVFILLLWYKFFQLITPGGRCAIYGCFSTRTIPGVTLYRSNVGGTFLQLIFVVGWLKTTWKSKLKTKRCVRVDYSGFYLSYDRKSNKFRNFLCK